MRDKKLIYANEIEENLSLEQRLDFCQTLFSQAKELQSSEAVYQFSHILTRTLLTIWEHYKVNKNFPIQGNIKRFQFYSEQLGQLESVRNAKVIRHRNYEATSKEISDMAIMMASGADPSELSPFFEPYKE